MSIRHLLRALRGKAERGRKKYHDYDIPSSQKDIVRQFHELYYSVRPRTWGNTFWLGIPVQKCPMDLWVYHEILHEVKPDVIIECGTADGGSALFLACMCDMVNNGRVITVDINDKQSRPEHERIRYLHGSSTTEGIIVTIKNLINKDDKIMVILDSDHQKDHVLNELNIYSMMVSKGSYIIVEDTNVNGHPVWPEFGPGPMEAVEEFLKENANFTQDRKRERFFLTFNPGGFLRKEW